MSDRIGKLRTLGTLRRRDVDRRTRELAEGVDRLAEAEAAREAARRARTAAADRLQLALRERIAHPADPNVALFCALGEERLVEAEREVLGASVAFESAVDAVSGARRELVRAQVRAQALAEPLETARRKQRRDGERRESEACLEGRIRQKGAFAWA